MNPGHLGLHVSQVSQISKDWKHPEENYSDSCTFLNVLFKKNTGELVKGILREWGDGEEPLISWVVAEYRRVAHQAVS